ncbi:Flocculation protein FLO9 [Escovopsis weberi]|uniref:Flocculation protein FLO9 n=1 Tax=Escovopsis weberi TaxID=150374 RepID=A0A0M9VRU6_ESCWE|nr:Flocculation protein FLO9 [Escovopsis weberi]
MKAIKALAALALASSVDATAIPNADGIIECLLVDVVVNILKGYPSATPYCSTTVIPTTVSETKTVTGVLTSVVTPPPVTSCLHIPTSTLTQHPTVTKTEIRSLTSSTAVTAAPSTIISTVTKTISVTTSACPAPAACANQGLEWAYFNNTSGDNRDATYSNFLPESYKGKTPIYTGVINSIGGINIAGGRNVAIYGSTKPLWSSYFTLNHRGYIYSPQAGVYTFTASGIDDALFLWVGSELVGGAWTNWTRANADALGTFNRSPGFVTWETNLLQGEYYAMRFVFAQAQGAAVFSLTITAPDGSVFLGPNTPASPYLITRDCDNYWAVPYPPPK